MQSYTDECTFNQLQTYINKLNKHVCISHIMKHVLWHTCLPFMYELVFTFSVVYGNGVPHRRNLLTV